MRKDCYDLILDSVIGFTYTSSTIQIGGVTHGKITRGC
jgi:hypothetical protein